MDVLLYKYEFYPKRDILVFLIFYFLPKGESLNPCLQGRKFGALPTELVRYCYCETLKKNNKKIVLKKHLTI